MVCDSVTVATDVVEGFKPRRSCLRPYKARWCLVWYCLFFVKVCSQHSYDVFVAELLRPCDKGAVTSDFVVLDRLSVGNDGGV
jgi:hypothetical protein